MKKILITLSLVVLSVVLYSQNLSIINDGDAIHLTQGADTLETYQKEGLIFRSITPPICQFVQGGRVSQEFPYTYVVSPVSTSADNLVSIVGGYLSSSSSTSLYQNDSLFIGTDTVKSLILDDLTIMGDGIVVPAVSKIRLDGDAAGDTWVSEVSANAIVFAVGGVQYNYSTSEFIYASGLSWSLKNTAPSSTLASILPSRANGGNDGVGGAANEVSLIINSTETATARVGEFEVFGDLIVTGGHKDAVTTVNAATYDLLDSDYILNVTYTATGAVTSLTLPTAQVISGRSIVIKDAGGLAGTNNITVDTEGAQTIDGAATAVIRGNYDSINLYSDGTNWFIY